MDTFTIVVPVFNEQDHIKEYISELKEALVRKNSISHEIIIVNDGSTDNTYQEIRKIKGIKIINYHVNRGYGAALKAGINASKYQNIIITDGDNTYPTNEVSRLIDIFTREKPDMLVGARVGKSAKIPLIRRPIKFLLNRFANYLTGYYIPDLNSGLRIIDKSKAVKFIRLLPDGFSFTSTISIAFHVNKYDVQYENIAYHKRGGSSKINPFKDTINFFLLVIRTTLLFEPLRIFLPLSLIFFLLGTVFYILRLCGIHRFLLSIVLMYNIGFFTLIVGLLSDLIDRRFMLLEKE